MKKKKRSAVFRYNMFIVYNFDKIFRRLHHTSHSNSLNGAKPTGTGTVFILDAGCFFKKREENTHSSYFLSHSERFSQQRRLRMRERPL